MKIDSHLDTDKRISNECNARIAVVMGVSEYDVYTYLFERK